MPSLCLLIAFSLCLPLAASGQEPELNRRTPERETIRIKQERRITLDLEVTDHAGQAVRGLSQSEFVLNDNGDPKPITSFQEIDGSAAPPVEAILLLDTMNASFEDVVIMRQGIDAFLRQNGGHLRFPVSIAFVTDTGTKLNKPSTNGLELAKQLNKLQTPIPVIGTAQGTIGAMDRAQRSLHALQLLSIYEAARPGRKLALWMGPGWPLLAGDRVGEPGPENAKRYYASIVDMTTQLRRAHITLYSIAPLNLSRGNPQYAFLYQHYLNGVTSAAQSDSPNLGVQVLATHSGGLVLYKSGDLPSQISRCFADANSFYEITFDASPGDPLGVYHSIEITVGRPGVTTRTNTSYYAGPAQFTGSSLQASSLQKGAVTINPAAPQTIVRTQSRLLVLDVTVLDNKGIPVAGLKPSEFHLLDDNQQIKVTNLEEHTGTRSDPSPPQSATPENSAPASSIAVSNKPRAGSVWNIVAVDLINTPKEERGRLQNQLETFAKQIPPGTQMALVAMVGDIKLLSSFTDGQAGFARAVKKGLGSINVGAPANIVERGEIAESIDVNHSDSLQQKANIDVERQAQRAQMTLNDFSTMASWLRSYPGKKNVFWLSSGFPIEGKPFGSSGYNGLSGTSSGQKLPMQDKTDKELETARVAIYPLDVRGAEVADIAGETNADTGGDCAKCQVVNIEKDSDLNTGRHSEMLEIAHATGGVARFNNDLTKSLLQGLQQATSYYTLSYTPQDAMWDSKYHRFKITLDKPDSRIVYRQGYYALDAQPEPAPTADQFKAALEPDRPPTAAVRFTVNVQQGSDFADVQYAIDPLNVQFTPGADGKLLADLDCAILEFDAKDKILEKSLIRVSERSSSGQPQPLATSLNAKQTISLKSGATTLVIGVRDRATGLFGTLQASISIH